MRAVDAPEGVELVDARRSAAGEEVGPAPVEGEDPGVEHVGIGEHDVGMAAGPRPLVRPAVAVVGDRGEAGDVRTATTRSWSWARALVG